MMMTARKKGKHTMKKWIFSVLLMFCTIPAVAQESNDNIFKGRIENAEYQVWIEMNFYENNVKVPQQAVLGELPGYFGAKRDSRKWPILDADIKGNTATITLVNDYGSEDLVATLTHNADGTYTLVQKSGSTLKIAVNNKWVKIPKKLVLKKP